MLPVAHRLRRPPEFSRAVRRGRRVTRGCLVVHLSTGGPDLAPAGTAAATTKPARLGLVVGRAVGPAVVRNRVRRRLRELVRARLHALPPGSTLVVRALAGAGQLTFARLSRDLDAALAGLLPAGSVAGSSAAGSPDSGGGR